MLSFNISKLYYAGKTSWLLEFFRHQPVTQKIRHLIYYYSDEDRAHEKFKAIKDLNIIFRQGCPSSLEEVKDELRQFPKEDCKAVVFDDLYNDLRDYMSTLWTVTGSHFNTCFFLLAQSLYGDKQLRILSLNSKVSVILAFAHYKLNTAFCFSMSSFLKMQGTNECLLH